MTSRPRAVLAALIIGILALFTASGAMAQDIGLPLPGAKAADPAPPPAPQVPTVAGPKSPRELFESFLRAMDDAAVFDRPSRLDDALALLDLSQLPPEERVGRGRVLAVALRDVLEFHGRMEIRTLPAAGAVAGRTTWSMVTPHGSLDAFLESGRWLVAAETVGRIEAMRRAFLASGSSRTESFNLRSRMPPSLRSSTMGLEHWQWIGIACLALISWIAHRVVIFFAHFIILAILRKRGVEESVAVAADKASRPAGLFAVALVLFFASPLLKLPAEPVDLLLVSVLAAKFFASLGAVLICYGFADVIAARMAHAAAKTDSRLDDQLVPLLRKSIKILITLGGILFILDNLNVNVVSLVTGLGVIGLGVAFAAKDTIANLFGSLTVFLDRPFQVGDAVNVSGVEGVVEEVGFRSTRVRTYYDSLVSVPNAKLVDSTVDNMGRRRYRRFRTMVGVRYDTPVDRIVEFCEGIRAIVRSRPDMKPELSHISLFDWGASSINILVHVFFDARDFATEVEARQRFMVEVMQLAERLGVGFAFPTQTLHVESMPTFPPASSETSGTRDVKP